MQTDYHRPESWYSPDEPSRKELAIEALQENAAFAQKLFDEAAQYAYTWEFFLGGGGDWDCLHGDEINTFAPRYRVDEDGEPYHRLTNNELLVLLMDGTDEQTIAAKAALRDRLHDSASFQTYVEQKAEETVNDEEDYCYEPYDYI